MMLLLTEKCKVTEIHEILGTKYMRSPYHINNLDTAPAYQSMTFGHNTVTIMSTLPDLHKRIKALQVAYANKTPPAVTQQNAERPFRTGFRYGVTGSFEEGYHEPFIDISFNGGPALHLNGNYKPGMIRAFVKDSLKLT